MIRIIFVVVFAAILAGCVSTRNRHGFVMERGEDKLEAEIGIDTKESILARYGEPSVRPPLNDDRWYYLSFSTNARAFYNPDTTSRYIVEFDFDEQGKVINVATYDLEDGMNINLVDRETPTRGKELTFWEQLLGSVGQLPAPTGGPQGGPGGGP